MEITETVEGQGNKGAGDDEVVIVLPCLTTISAVLDFT
jgi:hypothetical protein